LKSVNSVFIVEVVRSVLVGVGAVSIV